MTVKQFMITAVVAYVLMWITLGVSFNLLEGVM